MCKTNEELKYSTFYDHTANGLKSFLRILKVKACVRKVRYITASINATRLYKSIETSDTGKT